MFFPLELWLVSFRIETGQGHVLIRKRGLPAREHFICVYPQKARAFSSKRETFESRLSQFKTTMYNSERESWQTSGILLFLLAFLNFVG
jgi:hypothetical protein